MWRTLGENNRLRFCAQKADNGFCQKSCTRLFSSQVSQESRGFIFTESRPPRSARHYTCRSYDAGGDLGVWCRDIDLPCLVSNLHTC